MARLPVQTQRPPAQAAAPSRPLALWDADPRTGAALVLARFRPDELPYALHLAATWAHRYDTLALGETPTPDQPETILALWQNGRRLDLTTP